MLILHLGLGSLLTGRGLHPQRPPTIWPVLPDRITHLQLFVPVNLPTAQNDQYR
ncbi:hypothetical protein H6F46_03590 [Limnothrix sp. FACHB-1083]|uniref:hypothetical protein n=1 Tax=unclassified Limnothrix TaxID=2632864 RepID=UPI001681919E|nr:MULTISPECIES: hypothetical protein [unclassified Limnothrix]MBD2159773.1 hypothetical protein [Limnothrix sp. FACHB-1083]MBD2190476.1 hypothetical protein [Limnothrix sp. FACHB-1088]